MQIERLRLKNFRAFRNIEMRDIPRLVALVGATEWGKSTLFSVFGFLRDAMASNVTVALAKHKPIGLERKCLYLKNFFLFSFTN